MAKTSVEIARDIAARITLLRGHRVLLDTDLAALHGVTTKRLNQQVRRNAGRFPMDFAFQLSMEEADSLRLQNATLKTGRGRHRKYRPWVFTEYGAIMTATILNSPRAVEISLYVVRAFVQLRELLASNRGLARRLDELEGKLQGHDAAITAILAAIRELVEPREAKRRTIGFAPDVESSS